LANYPTVDTDRRVDATRLKEALTTIFEACTMAEPDADLLAATLVHADLRGVHSHGVLRVPDYVKKLTIDGVDPHGRPTVVVDRGAALVIDANNSMGQIAGTFAMRAAIDRARQIGVGFAAVRRSNHCGAMDWYTLMAARDGMIGIAGTNALPTMAPLGGTDKIIGINPLSISFPGENEKPFVLDFAFGATAHGKIRVYQQKNSPLPEGWALDREGRPTTDAAQAMLGLIQPIGQHKGVGLAMAVGMLSTLLSGAAYGTESGNMMDGATIGSDGHFFLAVNPTFFGAERLGHRVDAIIQEVHQSRPNETTLRLLVPGELESEFEVAYGREGILLPGDTIDGIEAAAKQLGCDVSLSIEDNKPGRMP
jgi:LDH2 family malate/lactate/ureidoglycolate dehydrogenase